MMMRTLRRGTDQTTTRSRTRSGMQSRPAGVAVSARPSHNVVGNHGVLRRNGTTPSNPSNGLSPSKLVQDGTDVCRKPGCPCRFEESDLRRMDGRPAVGSLGDRKRIQIDDNQSPSGGSAGPGTPTPTCPTDIRVVRVGVIELSSDDADQGILTGWGGFATMEVSDPTGRNWDGTPIHENLEGVQNSCEEIDPCPNTHGQGGSEGSTFVVGEGASPLGMFNLPAERNRFHDVHIFAIQGGSLLHETGLDSCRHECIQTFDCNGQRFGPDFTLSREMYRDMLVGQGVLWDVTKIDLEKSE